MGFWWLFKTILNCSMCSAFSGICDFERMATITRVIWNIFDLALRSSHVIGIDARGVIEAIMWCKYVICTLRNYSCSTYNFTRPIRFIWSLDYMLYVISMYSNVIVKLSVVNHVVAIEFKCGVCILYGTSVLKYASVEWTETCF